MSESKWETACENSKGIKTILFNSVGQIIGYNGIQIGDSVNYGGEKYIVVMVSRLGDFGLSKTGTYPYTVRVDVSTVI